MTDLIVDLRYTGGGLLRVADTLLNLLGGIRANFQRSYIVNYNQDLQSNNYVGYFRTEPQSMIALRIAFITRGGTASASELLINSLDPHIEVVLVGDDTYGKAVGQSAYDQSSECETRLRLITFEIQNGLGQGGYYTGLYDSGRFDLCPAADDVTRPFGDVNEDSLATALPGLMARLSVMAPLLKNRAQSYRRSKTRGLSVSHHPSIVKAVLGLSN